MKLEEEEEEEEEEARGEARGRRVVERVKGRDALIYSKFFNFPSPPITSLAPL